MWWPPGRGGWPFLPGLLVLVAVSWVLGLVRGHLPVEVEVEVWAVGDFPLCSLWGTVW